MQDRMWVLLLFVFKDTTDFQKPTPVLPGSSASPKHALLTRFQKQMERIHRNDIRSTASSHSLARSSFTESKAESRFPPSNSKQRPCRLRRQRRMRRRAPGPRRSSGPRPPPAVPLGPWRRVPVPKPRCQQAQPGSGHHQLNPGCNNSWHLLVQDEVQVKSPVAGWTPFLPASPLPGADEHKSGQGETLEANAEGSLPHGGHDLQPRETVRSSASHAPRTRRGPQGRAIRGALLAGPLFPLALLELPGSNCLEEFKVFLLVSASILFLGFRFQESQYCTPRF